MRPLTFLGFPKYGIDRTGQPWTRNARFGKPEVWKKLKPWKVKAGYLQVFLRNDEGMTPFYVHQLVLLAFRGPCPPGMEARHLNDIKTDNRLRNLKWGTRLENRRDMVRNGRSSKGKKKPQCTGEHHFAAKFTNRQAKRIRRLFDLGYSRVYLSKKFNVSWNVVKILFVTEPTEEFE